MPIIYPSIEQAIEVHQKTVEVSGGGVLGHLDLGTLESVLQHIQNDDYYPTFASKLTHLFFCTCMFHCFQDGNKRIAISLSAQFLILNGYLFIAARFIHEMENISYYVAAGKIDKDLLGDILTAFLNGQEDSEEIKLRILNAISDGE
ncbi:MAG TPA: type II toxin-antitoxin system death-on-curing family toxin [Proteobacteria bacterium]|nr:type II toxin-antitoxin system death-on-curing family toxin [Pseudomonadota bacterium]